MAKYYGKIGFKVSKETSPGVYEDKIVFKSYRGDVLKNYIKSENSSNLTDDVNVSKMISIIGTQFAFKNFQSIRCVEYMGALWKVTTVDIQHPRLILTIGGVYNGPKS